jgi:hypothetical protein
MSWEKAWNEVKEGRDPWKIAQNYKTTDEPISNEILKERKKEHLCAICGGIKGSVLNTKCRLHGGNWYCIFHKCPSCRVKKLY